MTNYATKNYDVTPDISLMKKMASISGTIPSRLMELVDNAIDARIPGEQLVVEVKVVKQGSRQYIEISDNGTGMTELVARSYFRLGESQKAGKNKIGRFGLGSKVAILGMGNTCKVDTSPIGENYSIDINFDVNKFKSWKIKYKMREKSGRSHGTKIRIENVTIRIGNIKRFCEKLHEQFAKVYKHFIESGEVAILINGEAVNPMQVDLLPELYKEFDFTLRSGKRVRGWAGATKKAGQNWKFGFDLINHGRIIKPNDFLSRQAHTSLARLTGEIHLDDFPTDVHKTDFLRDNDDFQEMQILLIEEELAELITKITKLTNREVFTKYQNDMQNVSRVLNRVLRSYDFLNYLDIEDGIFKKLKHHAEKNLEKKEKEESMRPEEPFDIFDTLNAALEEEQRAVEPPTPEAEDETDLPEEPKEPKRKRDTGLIIEEPIGISAGIEHPSRRWMATEFDAGVRLTIEVNLDHPTYQIDDEKGVSVYMRNAVLDSVAEFILQEEKTQNGYVEDEIERLNRLKDMLIRHSLAA